MLMIDGNMKKLIKIKTNQAGPEADVKILQLLPSISAGWLCLFKEA